MNNNEVIINKNIFDKNSYFICDIIIGDYKFIAAITIQITQRYNFQQYINWKQIICMFTVLNKFRCNNHINGKNQWRNWCVSNKVDANILKSCDKYFTTSNHHILLKNLKQCVKSKQLLLNKI
eukprot:280442_1